MHGVKVLINNFGDKDNDSPKIQQIPCRLWKVGA